MHRLIDLFHDRDLDRGQLYFKRRDFVIEHAGHGVVVASVEGTTRYRVALESQGQLDGSWQFGVYCSCPRFEQGHLCKHLAAVCLACQRRRVFDQEEWQVERFEKLVEMDESTVERLVQVAHEQAQTELNGSQERFRALEERVSDGVIALPEALSARHSYGDNVLWLVIPLGGFERTSGIHFATYRQKPRQDGTLGKRSKFAVSRRDWGRYQSHVDRDLLELLFPFQSDPPAPSKNSAYFDEPSFSRLILPGKLALLLLPRLLETGRVLAEVSQDGELTHVPVRWDDGAPYTFRVSIEGGSKSDAPFTMSGFFEQESGPTIPASGVLAARLDVDAPPPSGMILLHDRVVQADLKPADLPWVETLVAEPPLEVSRLERERLERLLGAHPTPELQAPEELRFDTELLRPIPRLELAITSIEQRSGSVYRSGRSVFLEITPGFDYPLRDGTIATVSLNSVATVWFDEDSNVRQWRNADDEDRYTKELMAVPLMAGHRRRRARRPTSFEETPLTFLVPLPGNAATALRSLFRSLSRDWRIFFDAQPVEIAEGMDARISTGVDWFELETGASFAGQTKSLPELLEAVRKDDGIVALDDGTIGLIPEEWLSALDTLSSLATDISGSERVRLDASQLLFFDHLLEAQLGARLSFDRKAKRLLARLHDFESIGPASQPREFTGRLRDYQKVGLGWLLFLREHGLGGCLADDMGLGKTVQVLALLQKIYAAEKRAREKAATEGEPDPSANTRHRPSLVVVPKSVVDNWLREAEVFTPQLSSLRYWGTNRRQLQREIPNTDLVVTTYGTLRQDIESLAGIAWNVVVLDEAQAIKNVGAKTTLAARRLAARQRLALTGTPVENHLGELASIFEFLNPGMTGLESLRGLEKRALPEIENGELLIEDESELRAAAKALRPLILRRTKEAVLDDLPAKTEATLMVDLAAKQRSNYQELLGYYQQKIRSRIDERGVGGSKFQVLEALLRLRQAACHPGLIDPERQGDPSAKFEVLLEQLEECTETGHKALVFSQFTSLFALLRPHLDRLGMDHLYLDGKTTKRQELVDHFQNEADPKLFLISLKAGGLGLNLTAADYVFILDPWWNPAVEAQAVDRAHRIGQTRSVFAYRLIARDTVEERIAQLQNRKRALSDAILGEDKSLIESMTRDDIELLLS